MARFTKYNNPNKRTIRRPRNNSEKAISDGFGFLIDSRLGYSMNPDGDNVPPLDFGDNDKENEEE